MMVMDKSNDLVFNLGYKQFLVSDSFLKRWAQDKPQFLLMLISKVLDYT